MLRGVVMLEVGLLEVFVIMIGIVIGFLMIDTKPSNAAREHIEKRLSDAIPHPNEVNSIPKLIGYIGEKRINRD